MADIASDGLFQASCDDLTIIWASPGLGTFVGRDTQDLLGSPLQDLVHPEDRPGWLHACDRCRNQPETDERLRLRALSANRRWRWTELRLRHHTDATDERSLIGSLRDVHTETLALDELRHRAATDALTGLTSRGEGLTLLERQLRHHPRSGNRLAIGYLDIDGLKTANDRFGHAVGDELLYVTGLRIRSCVRSDDLVVRLGGDELLLVLPGVRDLTDASHLAEQIRAATALPITVDDVATSITVSLGITLARPDDTVDTLIRRADQAMYQAKNAGGNRIHATT